MQKTSDIPADKIMRLRPNRCLWQAPPPYKGKGRPPKDGEKFKLSDSTTWGTPVESLEVNDPVWGLIQIQRWEQLHFRQSASEPMEAILIQRQGKGLSSRTAKPIWLACLLAETLPLESIWRLYLRRFAVDHWNRLAKQRLHWTLRDESLDIGQP